MAHNVPWRIERNTAYWPFYGCMYHAILFASARYRLYLLRNKVEPSGGARLIHTIRGIGYCLRNGEGQA